MFAEILWLENMSTSSIHVEKIFQLNRRVAIPDDLEKKIQTYMLLYICKT